MTYAVHSLHVPSVKVTSGTYTLDGQTRIPSPLLCMRRVASTMQRHGGLGSLRR